MKFVQISPSHKFKLFKRIPIFWVYNKCNLMSIIFFEKQVPWFLCLIKGKHLLNVTRLLDLCHMIDIKIQYSLLILYYKFEVCKAILKWICKCFTSNNLQSSIYIHPLRTSLCQCHLLEEMKYTFLHIEENLNIIYL